MKACDLRIKHGSLACWQQAIVSSSSGETLLGGTLFCSLRGNNVRGHDAWVVFVMVTRGGGGGGCDG